MNDESRPGPNHTVRSGTSTTDIESSGHAHSSSQRDDSEENYPSYTGSDGITRGDNAGKTAADKEKDQTQVDVGVVDESEARRRKARNEGSGAMEEDVFVSEEAYERAQRGKEKMKRLGWIKMAILLCVEAVALGALSLPGAFASVGMIAGVILTIGIGLIAIYAGYLCGAVFNRFPYLRSYADAGRVLFAPLGPRWAKFGFEFFGAWLCLLLVFNYASHTLTGALMWQSVTGALNVCSIVWVVISAALLSILAAPPTFSEFAILGYIDFISIIAAILITIIATGVSAGNSPGGLADVSWSAFPPPGTDFYTAFSSVTQIVFAYSFSVVLFSFQIEMHRPEDVSKSIWVVGMVQMLIYTLTGALVYRFVGDTVESPAILSNPGVLQQVAFGIAIPVIFISGSINGCVVARYVHGRIFENSRHRYLNTFKGWTVWIIILTVEAILALIIAEAIPFFSDLLSLISSLFISGFSFFVPAIMWFVLLRDREAGWFSRANLPNLIMSSITLVFGLVVLVAGLASSIVSIKDEYTMGSVRTPFSCPAFSSSEA